MKQPVKVPSAGESVTEAFIGAWKKKTGDMVRKGEVIVDLESQKATFELAAEFSGKLEIIKATAGERVRVGDVIAYIDDSATAEAGSPSPQSSPTLPAGRQVKGEGERSAADGGKPFPQQVGPAARRRGIVPAGSPSPQPSPIKGEGGKPAFQFNYTVDTSRGERTEKASRIRKHIAENLVAAQHMAAILTTFNEINMGKAMALRKKYKDTVKAKHGASVGIVGMFAMAALRALKMYPIVNSTFTGEDIIKRDFIDLSIAVSTDRGLVVPVIRDAQNMDWIAFEKSLGQVAEKARDGKLSIPEMTGGTFTITNGGVFGSLIATPLLNMPQTAILGLHKIEERPIAVEGKVEIHPMMYVALSYDHRLLDGKDSVQFLVALKEAMENPGLIIDEGKLA